MTAPPTMRLGSAPVRAVRPASNKRNIALPVEVFSTVLKTEVNKVPSSDLHDGGSDVSNDDKVLPWACRISVGNGYPLMRHLHQQPQWMEQFSFDTKTSTWFILVKTEKMFHHVIGWLEEKCRMEKLTFIDNTSRWMDTSTVTHINIHTGYEGPDSTTEVLWCSIHGECYFIRKIAKSYGGCFQWVNKAWDGVALEAIPIILKECFNIGITLMGNFNHDGSFTEYLQECGAYIDSGTYKWNLQFVVTTQDEDE